MNERTNETNERKKERTNERTNERQKLIHPNKILTKLTNYFYEIRKVAHNCR